MRSAGEIVAHIEKKMQAMLLRPKMYASSPEALEDVLWELDRLREFALDERQLEADCGAYSAFLCNRGFGAGTFCQHTRNGSLTDKDLKLFEDLARFWREYMDEDPLRT